MSQVADIRAVRTVINNYINAWSSRDIEDFERLFHPRFLMSGYSSKGVEFTGAERMIPILKETKATWNSYHAEITHLECAGSVACATLQEDGFLDLPFPATSFFHLIKVEGRWLIVSKSYHYHRENTT